MREVTITLTVEQINTVLQVLGQQPTAMGVWPLLQDIKAKAEAALAEGHDELPTLR